MEEQDISVEKYLELKFEEMILVRTLVFVKWSVRGVIDTSTYDRISESTQLIL